MIFGIGHDIVENKRIHYLLSRFDSKFIHKTLSTSEIDSLATKSNLARFIAKRFAAKEAFAKACGTGLRSPILMPDISVINNDSGKPIFCFGGAIQSWLEQNHIRHCHLSISDEISISSAFVILET